MAIRPRKCSNCSEVFRTQNELGKHIKASVFYPCITCAREFQSLTDLKKHIKDTTHQNIEPHAKASLEERLQFYLQDAYYQEKVIVSRENRRKCRKIVKDYLEEILKYVREQKDGELFNGHPVPAGSTATQTKIILADEFDFNLVLAQPFVDYARFEGDEVKYQLKGDEGKSLKKHLKLTESNVVVYDHIPNGFIEALHKNNARRCITEVSYAQKVIPRWIQENLYKKVDRSLSKDSRLKKNVELIQSPHGPAVSLFINDPRVTHKISVDLSVSIDIGFIEVTAFGWPRPQTKKVLSKEKIDAVIQEGLHLVPKKELYWYVSTSKAAKVLMNSLDGSDDCRKICHQILKKDFQTWKSQSKYGMYGISTYIFKHHLLWMNENEIYQRKDYWRDQNIGRCYMDMLSDLASKLEEGRLMNYFKENENILEGKRPVIMTELAECLRARHKQLQHIRFE